MPNQINEEFLSRQEMIAKHEIEAYTPSEMFPGIQPHVILGADQVVAWVCYTRHLHGTVIDLLGEKNTAEKQLKETQYLSTLWIKALTSVMPKKMQKRAMKVAGQVIAKGMQEAGMESYDADLGQLEEQTNSE